MSHVVQPTSNKAVEKLNQNLPISQQDKSLLQLAEIYQPIKDELGDVERLLKQELENDVPWVDQLLQHISELGGKRIRPAFVLLSGACAGAPQSQSSPISGAHIQMAAALEMIHTATLIHDDILDEATTRRHKPTVNSKWGDKVGLLLGDYLFTHAFHVASFAESPAALRALAASSNRVCQGEMRQNHWQGKYNLTEQDYLMMIAEKTAELCGCGCRIGALLSNASESDVERYEEFGTNLGVAFQIVDDVLDLIGRPEKVGKTLGTDVVNEKPTLPLIHCLAQSSGEERNRLIELLSSGGATAEEVLPFLISTDSVDYSRSVARDHAKRSHEFALTLPNVPHAKSMRSLAEFVLQRSC